MRYSCGPSLSYTASRVAVPKGLQGRDGASGMLGCWEVGSGSVDCTREGSPHAAANSTVGLKQGALTSPHRVGPLNTPCPPDAPAEASNSSPETDTKHRKRMTTGHLASFSPDIPVQVEHVHVGRHALRQHMARDGVAIEAAQGGAKTKMDTPDVAAVGVLER